MKSKIVAIVGTRPEAIKMVPVIRALKQAAWCDCRVVATAQHRQMLDQVLGLFGIEVDEDLDLMRDDQSLSGLTARLFQELDRVLLAIKPALVLAQGDTTTAMVAAMSAFYHRIPFGHVEAGLRTGDLGNPFPEEANRIIAGRLATLHFAPTSAARDALLREGVAAADIHLTGNTVIDALLSVADTCGEPPVAIAEQNRLILVTAHRRENFGAPMERIFRALEILIERHEDVEIIYPVHPNPNVRRVAHERLGHLGRVHLVEPLDYRSLVATLKRSWIVITDSGGLQEEAPALGKPVLVLRAETERPEAVDAGVAKLVGTTTDDIVREAGALLEDPVAYAAMARHISPYGDGKAAARIRDILEARLAPTAQTSFS